MKLNKVALGLAGGIVWGAIVFLATWSVILRSGTGELTGKLARFYIGYSMTPEGSIIGLVYGFITAFIIAYIFAALYNAFSGSPKEKG